MEQDGTREMRYAKPRAAGATGPSQHTALPTRHAATEPTQPDAAAQTSQRAAAQAHGKNLWAKRAFVIAVALIGLGATVAWLVLYGADALSLFTDGQRLQAWVDERGALAPVIMVLLVVVQVVIAVVPGEPLELGAGYAFGFWEGTALCLVGSLIGTLIVVALTRTVGMRVVELFFSREKIASLSWLRSSSRFELLLFVCFLIPGTPKDILTYVAGLTPCGVGRIAAITTVGRIPSIVSSTLASAYAAQGDWAATALVAVLTLALVGIGVGAYAFISKREKRREDTRAS